MKSKKRLLALAVLVAALWLTAAARVDLGVAVGTPPPPPPRRDGRDALGGLSPPRRFEYSAVIHALPQVHLRGTLLRSCPRELTHP